MDPGTRPLRDADCFLVVRFWIAPNGEPQMMRWLKTDHLTKVLHQPEFL